jgi:hypothetical protein
MHGFEPADVVEQSAQYTIWRQPLLAGIKVLGRVDDRLSDRWREAVLAEFDKRGWPRYFALDSSDSDPVNSIASRLRTAAFVRDGARRVQWTGVLTTAKAGPLVVVRTVLRVVGVSNVALFTAPVEFRRALDEARVGIRPRLGESAPVVAR